MSEPFALKREPFVSASDPVKGRYHYRYKLTDFQAGEPYEAGLSLGFHGKKGQLRFDPKRPASGKPYTWTFITQDTQQAVEHPYQGQVSVELTRGGQPIFTKQVRGGHPVHAKSGGPGAPDTIQVPKQTLETFNAYVVDRFPAGALLKDHGHPSWHDKIAGEIESGLADMLRETYEEYAAEKNKALAPDHGVRVSFVRSFPKDIQPNELMIYVCAFGKSAFPSGTRAAARSQGANGLTGRRAGGKVLSEVWPDTIGSGAGFGQMRTLMINLIMHEWMHVKLDIDEPDDGGKLIHDRGFGLGVLPISSTSNYTGTDRKDMVAAWDKTFQFSPV